MTSLTSLRRRASRRMVPGDVPEDLEGMLDDPIRLLSGPVREMADGIARHERGKAVVDRKPMFGIPSAPASSRQETADGRRSFHLSKNRTQSRTAREFDAYAAGERTPRLGEERVVESDGAAQEPGEVSRAAQPAREADERSASVFDRYGDRGAAADGSRFELTTLSKSPLIRSRQWDQIEDFERTRRPNAGGPPRINIRYELDSALMLDIARRNDCPEGLRDVILAERARVERGRALPDRKAEIGVPWIDPGADAAMAWIEEEAGWEQWRETARKKGKTPFKLSAGRGVQAVFAGDAEFPTPLDRAARLRVIEGLNAFVQGQAADAASAMPDDEAGSSPWIVPAAFYPHVPDALNNRQNDHFHFLIAARLAQADEAGNLTFTDTKLAALTRKDWPERFRAEFARLCNVELERGEAGFRLDPRSYKAMGIEDAAPMQKLHGSLTVLERAGVPTAKGVENAAEGWRREFAHAERTFQAERLGLERDHVAAARSIDDVDEEAERTRLKDELARAQRDAERALLLRHEAAQIELLIAMACSRAELVAEFAPGYAAKARGADDRDSYDAHGWRARNDQATTALVEIAHDLTIEYQAIADRQREAHALDADAAERNRSIALSVEAARAARAEVQGHSSASMRVLDAEGISTPALSPHAAVNLISATPLLLSQVGGRFVVRAEDDPAGRVRGVDLDLAASRLRGVHRVQQKELAQLTAYAQRHGAAACRGSALAHADKWIRDTADKWRDTPAFARLMREVQAPRLLACAKLIDGFAAANDDEPILALPGHLPDRIRSLADLPAETLNDNAVVVAEMPAAPPLPAAVRAAPLVERVAVQRTASAPEPWTPEEQRHRAFARADLARSHARTTSARFAALEARAGEASGPTPLAARLLLRAYAGLALDPTAHRPGLVGDTLDHRDTVEIGILRHHPLFAERLNLALLGDPALLAQAGRSIEAAGPRNPLGRVPLLRGRLDFAYDDKSGSGVGLRTPSDWAEDSLSELGNRLPRLSREGALFGVADERLLDVMRHNHVGILHPVIQQRLEAEWRVQREQDRAVRSVLWHRSAPSSLRSWRDLASGNRMTHVAIHTSDPDIAAAVTRRATDPLFYYLCREADMQIGRPPARLEHADAQLRAWLRAQQDGATAPVLALLRTRAQARGGTAKAELEALASSHGIVVGQPTPPESVFARSRRSRRFQPRGLPPDLPGRG